MIHTSSYTVNISPNKGYTIVDLNQNENGRELVFILVDDEAVNIPSGTTATLIGTKPDGAVFSAEGNVDAENRSATFIEDEQMAVIAGKWEAKLKLIYSGETIATSRILFNVDPDIIEEGAIPSDSEVQGILAEMRHYLEEVRSEAYGSPLIATVSTDLIDRNRVYVYIGNEEGYEPGYWYYFDGEKWTVGGSYNAIDDTLSQVGKAADAKTTGEALETKVDKVEGKGLSTEDFTSEEKEKLAAIEPGSTRIIVDDQMSDTSTNPVQNGVIKAYIDEGNVTDKTLSVLDKSADSKATGDAIAAERDARIAAVTAEEQARKTQVLEKATELQSAIDAEAANRRRAVADEAELREAAINQEIQNRISAVNAEAAAREQAVSKEVLDREEAIANLKSQIDENITAYFYERDPSVSELPSSSWDTNSKKSSHLGDLYYNMTTGYLWRWRYYGGVYSWQRIVDADTSKALADAAIAIEAVNQVNAKLNRKADKTEIPTKISALTNDANYATKTYVDEKTTIAVDTTLKVSGVAADSKAVGDALAKKVDKVTGKGLSTNDFTTAEREKLAGISLNATRVIVDYSMVEASANPVQSRVIKAYVDNKTGDLQYQIDHMTKPEFLFESMDGNWDIEEVEPAEGEEELNTIQTRIKLCSKDAASWASETRIAMKGEVLIEWVTENNITYPRIKIGDGENVFRALPYIGVDLTEIQSMIDTAVSGKVDKETGKGLSTNDYTTAEKNKLSGIESNATRVLIDSTLTETGKAADAKNTGDAISALSSDKIDSVTLSEGATNGTTKVSITKNGTTTESTAQVVKGLKSAAFTESTDYATAAEGALARAAMPVTGGEFTGPVLLEANPTNDLGAATKQYVDNSIVARLAVSDSMVLRGTLGIDGTIDSLPVLDIVRGDTYKIITDGTYAGQVCKVGDLIVAMNTGDIESTEENWLLVPSGNEEVTAIRYSTTETNLTTASQTGVIILGEAATKQIDTSIASGSTSTKLPTSAAVATYADTIADGKVDKETGKGLSTEDYTSTEKSKLAGIEAEANKTVVDDQMSDASTNPIQNGVVKGYVDTGLSGKVDKETGKGLSTNDYTTAEKNKLSAIEAGAEVNINPDWNATSGAAEILNKPAIPTKLSDLTDDSDFVDETELATTLSDYVEDSDLTEMTAAEFEALLVDE